MAGTYGAIKEKPTDTAKLLCLYNVAAKRFLGVGGQYGTHATMVTTPHGIWLESPTPAIANTYYINNYIGSGSGTYVWTKKANQVYMDASPGGQFVFEKADGYSETNKVYRLKLGQGKYLMADAKSNNCNPEDDAKGSDNYNYQVWKLISRAEYYELAKANPANMEALIDFSFLMKAPDFRVNDIDALAWELDNTSVADKVWFGDNYTARKYSNRGATGDPKSIWSPKYDGEHQRVYGQYYFCYAWKACNYRLSQTVKVHKAGWCIIRCNGFSTQTDANGKPMAKLFVSVIGADGKSEMATSEATLNLLPVSLSRVLMNQGNNNGAAVGMAFMAGQYENQVQICVEKTSDGNEISSEHPVTLRIGFSVADGATVTDNDLTAVDNFKLLYAGPRRNPELILDEDLTDMNYIANATDEYKNSVLHLHRTLNDNKWNSLILPVNLTRGQLKRTFGDNVKLAELKRLTSNSIQFVTVEPSTDDEVMLKAFTPYIIYPPVVDVTSQAYTADRFYTSEEADNNSEWLGKDGISKSTDEDNRLSVTIAANHYDITMVSLDRNALKKYVDPKTWKSATRTSTETGNYGSMTCYGTMAKTFTKGDNGNEIISGRDDLAGDFIMYRGNLWQVPADKTYGLKGFRCWFELGDNSQTGNQASIYIDGIEDSTTGIEDIHTNPDLTSHKRGVDGVFTLDGQLVRRGTSTEGLPKGIYISNGRKIVVR